MKVQFTHEFIKIYKNRFRSNKKIQTRFEERVRLFAEDYQNETLRDHLLSGKLKGHRAFSITGDVRVIYYIHKDTAYFVDIGTHNQVYEE